MTYTRKQCKEDMIKLWSELARTGSFTKSNIKFTLSKEFYNYIFDMPFTCPCCKLVAHFDKDENCHECPINWEVKPIRGQATCMGITSPYYFWTISWTKLNRQYYANRILIFSHMIRI